MWEFYGITENVRRFRSNNEELGCGNSKGKWKMFEGLSKLIQLLTEKLRCGNSMG